MFSLHWFLDLFDLGAETVIFDMRGWGAVSTHPTIPLYWGGNFERLLAICNHDVHPQAVCLRNEDVKCALVELATHPYVLNTGIDDFVQLLQFTMLLRMSPLPWK